MDSKKIFLTLIGASLLYGLIKMAAKSWQMSEKEWKRRIANGTIGNPMKGKIFITSPFGMRKNPMGAGTQFHNGVDLVQVPFNTTDAAPLFASAPGKVVSNYFNALGGYQLIIDSGWAKFGYAHLKEASPLPVGTIVRKGQRIGRIGNTGASNGSHLHFTLRLNNVLVNPVENMPGILNATK